MNEVINISIIIPIYNTEKYLEECIDSILKQDLEAIEIILVDDGSTDNSLEIIKKYNDMYCNVYMLTQKNMKPGGARNLGLSIAKGKYVLYMDSDDILGEGALTYCYNIAEKENIDVVVFQADIFSNIQNKNKNQYIYQNNINEINKKVKGIEFVKNNYFNVPMLNIPFMIISHKFLLNNKLKFLENILYEDIEFYYRMMACNPTIKIIDKIFYYRRYRGNSIMTSKCNENSIKDKINIYNSIGLIDNSQLQILYKMIAIRGIRKALQECQKNSISLNEQTKKFINKIIENLYLYNNNFSIDLDKYACQILWNIITGTNIVDKALKKRLYKYLYSIKDILKLYEENINIGIYGMNDDCKMFFNVIENLYGKLKCSFFYIDSYIKTGEKNRFGYVVYNIKDINNIYLDLIFIGSYLYENQLLKNIQKYTNIKQKTYTLKTDMKYYLL